MTDGICGTCGANVSKRQAHTATCASRPLPYRSPGQMAYEEDVRRRPSYDSGKPRKPWDQLGPLYRETWEKEPTPRDWDQR